MKNNLAQKALNILSNEKNIMEETLAARLGTNKVKSVVETLRKNGHAVYTNNVQGKKAFRLGRPTASVVAAGYAALAKQHPFGK